MRTKAICLTIAFFLSCPGVQGLEVPFGRSGIQVTLPTWKHSCIMIEHYKNSDSFDLTIYTFTLSPREDKGEGILLRFSPTIKTYDPQIQEALAILGRIKRGDRKYSQWDLDKKGQQFSLRSLLKGKNARQLHDFRLAKGSWHAITRYYKTDDGIFVISVWSATGNPQKNEELVKAMNLIHSKKLQGVGDQHEMQ